MFSNGCDQREKELKLYLRKDFCGNVWTETNLWPYLWLFFVRSRPSLSFSVLITDSNSICLSLILCSSASSPPECRSDSTYHMNGNAVESKSFVMISTLIDSDGDSDEWIADRLFVSTSSHTNRTTILVSEYSPLKWSILRIWNPSLSSAADLSLTHSSAQRNWNPSLWRIKTARTLISKLYEQLYSPTMIFTDKLFIVAIRMKSLVVSERLESTVNFQMKILSFVSIIFRTLFVRMFNIQIRFDRVNTKII